MVVPPQGGSNSAGRVRPCQGRCRRFESGLPLHIFPHCALSSRAMSNELVARLEQAKSHFYPGSAGELEGLLAGIVQERFSDAEDLVRLHEALLFFRAYPASEKVARLADRILFSFADRIAPEAGADP